MNQLCCQLTFIVICKVCDTSWCKEHWKEQFEMGGEGNHWCGGKERGCSWGHAEPSPCELE